LPDYNGRPHLHTLANCRNVEFTGIKWANSPQFHLKQNNCDNLWFHDMEIEVDLWGQMNLGKFFGMEGPSARVPTYPLNTDGIDPAASNVLIERVKITNHDDAVAVKPSHNTDSISKCSEHIIVRDVEVHFGVGMTIGSVPPRDSYACVRDVHFENITFYHPYKAIYVKTNPGTTTSMLPGSGGEITNITYTNIVSHNPIWWNIYIGPQQQKQPGGGGPGCMFYPWAGGDDTCATQPLITVSNIQLHNVTTHGGIFPPGIIRGNSTNPMTDIVWDNVHSRGWWKLFGLGFITEFAEGTVINSKPIPAFTNLPASMLEAEEPECPIMKMFKSIVNMIEHAWEFLWPTNWF
jgi:polygalacturonase